MCSKSIRYGVPKAFVSDTSSRARRRQERPRGGRPLYLEKGGCGRLVNLVQIRERRQAIPRVVSMGRAGPVGLESCGRRALCAQRSGSSSAQVRGGIAASGCQLLRSLAAAKQAVAGCKCPDLRERSCGTSLSGGMKYKNKVQGASICQAAQGSARSADEVSASFEPSAEAPEGRRSVEARAKG